MVEIRKDNNVDIFKGGRSIFAIAEIRRPFVIWESFIKFGRVLLKIDIRNFRVPLLSQLIDEFFDFLQKSKIFEVPKPYKGFENHQRKSKTKKFSLESANYWLTYKTTSTNCKPMQLPQ